MLRRGLAVLAVIATAVAGLPLLAQPAAAVGAPVAFSSSALDTWQTNDVVWATASAQGLVFAGGDFTRIRPKGQPDLVTVDNGDGTTSTVPNPADLNRASIAVFDAATGNPTDCVLDAAYTSNPTAVTIRTMNVSPDGNTLYVGGLFNKINGASHNGIAAINIATCTVISSFAASANGFVRAIESTDTRIYLGGSFGNVNGSTREQVAALNTNGSLVTSFVSNFTGTTHDTITPDVYALALRPDNSQLVVGGAFDTAVGASSHGLAVVDAGTGALVHAFPNFITTYQSITNHGSQVKTIAVDSTGFYFGAEGTGKYVFDGRGAVNWDTFDERWRDGCLGATQALLLYHDLLYVASHAHDCTWIRQYGDGQRRHFLTESTLSGNPVGNAGTPALMGWTPDTNDGTGEGIGPRTLTVATSGGVDYLWSGGEFTTVNGSGQQGLTRFGHSNSVGPTVTPVVTATSDLAGQVTVAVRSTNDNDDGTLTYRIYRDGAGVPAYTATRTSLPWNRPQLTWTDSQPIGSTHTYRVTASDGSNTPTSTTVSATVTGSTSVYSQRVNADGPDFHLRLSESSGLFLSDSSGNDNNFRMNSATGATFQQTGALAGDPDEALSFSGDASSYATSEKRFDAPATYTLETWFKTTSTGGKLIGFTDSATNPSQVWDGRAPTPHIADKMLYMTTAGNLIFGTEAPANGPKTSPAGYNSATPGGTSEGAKTILTSPKTYKNGTWHYAVATQDSNGMTLYVDGARVARNTTTTHGDGTGFWRIGGDSINGWPSAPGTTFWNGTLDETSVYSRALSPTEVSEHFALAGGTFQDGPTDYYGKTVYDEQPLFQWRLNEASGTNAADATGAAETGTYAGTFAYAQPSAVAGVSGSLARSVKLNGSTAQVHSSGSLPSPGAFTSEAWVKTASTTGGQISGFGSAATGNSGTQDRKVWFRNDGKISFGIRQGTGYYVVTSPNAYNDNVFHHVVATRSSTTMALWVDGVIVASLDQVANQSYTGYWRFGGDSFTGWPTPPTSSYLNGYLDELAVYPQVLSPDRIAAHYSAGAPSAGPDVAAPTAPSAVTAGLNSNDVILSWRASLDNVGVTGYEIHRSTTAGFTPDASNKIATVTTTSYTDPNVAQGTYYYRVVATDAAGNTTSSNQVSVLATDVAPPTTPTNVTAIGGTSTASLSWSPSTDNTGVAGYAIYRSGTSGFAVSPATLIATTQSTSYSDAPPGNQVWYYRIVAQDNAGNVSPPSAEVSANVQDNQPPTNPATLSATSAGGTVTLTWAAASDNGAVAGYKVYRSATSGSAPIPANLVRTTTGTGTTTTDTPGVGSWFYVVTAFDAIGNEGGPSPEKQVYVAVTTALSPTSDTWANEGAKTQTNATTTTLVSRKVTGAVPYLRFVIPASPAGTDLTSAVLRLHSTTATACGCTTGGTVDSNNVVFANDSWDETTLNWNNKPAFTSAPLATVGAIADNVSFDISLDPVAMRAVTGTQVTLALQALGNDNLYVYSQNHPTVSLRPQLLVSYSPAGFDPDAPTQPVNVAATRTGGTVHLTWNASSNTTGAPHYDVYRSSTPGVATDAGHFLATTTTPSYDDNPGIGTWYYKIVAANDTNHRSPASDEVTITVADYTPPTAPTNVVVTNDGPNVTATWTGSTDDTAVTTYELHRGASADFTPTANTVVATVTADTLTATDSVPAGDYFYKVVAKDAVGNAGASAATELVVSDGTSPTDPTNLVATQGAPGAHLTWTGSTDAFGVSYEVHRSTTPGFTPDGTNLQTIVSGTSYDDTAALGQVYYQVVAIDPTGNASAPTNEADIVVADGTPPAAIDDLAATPTTDSVNLTWSAPTDNVGTTGYDIYRGTAPGVDTGATPLASTTTPGYTDPAGVGSWYYAVIAYDAVGNRSLVSNEVNGIVADSTPPSTPSGLTASVNGPEVDLSWTASTDDQGVQSYEIHRSQTPDFVAGPDNLYDNTPDNGTTYVDHPGVGTWYYAVIAVDSSGNQSTSSSNDVTATLSDTTPPTAPGSLTAVQDVQDVDLTWTPSTDDFGVAGYDVYRSTTSGFTPTPGDLLQADLTTTSYTDSTAVIGTTYYYVVVAKDGTPNSTPSSQASIAVTDKTPPTASTLSATVNQQTVSLSWTAATDNVGVTGYQVYRSTNSAFVPDPSSLVTTVPGTATSLNDAPGAPGTYYYRLVAIDAAGNSGPASNTATAAGVTAGTPTVVSLNPVADTFANQGAATTNYGTNTSLLSKGGTTGQGISYLRWTIPAAPAGKKLSTAVLTFKTTTDTTSGSGDTHPVKLVTNTTWTETGLTWNNKPAVSTTLLGTLSGATAANTAYSKALDATAIAPLVGTTFSMAIQGSATDSLYFWSKNYGTASARPTLVLTYLPTAPDTQAPTAPTSLSATSTATGVNLSWTASTDNVGVTGYNVYRSATSGFTPDVSTKVATVTGTTRVDAPGVGTWYYKVIATDAAANASSPSNEANATVAPDTSAPTAPGTPSAIASGTTVSLSWAASTDNVGVAAYDVYRSATSGFTPDSTTLVTTVSGTSTSTTDTPGVGTWYYVIGARDAAGNSATSTQVSATVSSTGPPTVVTLSPTADAFANAGAATTNYGTDASLLSRGSTGAASYLRFVLPAAPAGKSLTSAVIKLHTTTDTTSGSAATHTVRISADSWTEAAINWNNKPSATTGTLLGTISGYTAANTAYSTALTPSVLTPLLGTQQSFAITSTGTDSLYVWSRNFGTVASRPQLVLTFS